MREISFTIPGRIGGKGRPRFDPRSGRAYTPKATETMEGIVRHFAHQAMVAEHAPMLMGPLSLSIQQWRMPPKSWSKAKTKAAEYVTGKPDADNIIKLCADSMNAVVYQDDSQIAELYFVRRYSSDEGEGVRVIISELSGAA